MDLGSFRNQVKVNNFSQCCRNILNTHSNTHTRVYRNTANLNEVHIIPTQRVWWRTMHRWWPFRERDSCTGARARVCVWSREIRVMKVLNFTYTLQAMTQSNVVRSTLSDEKCHERYTNAHRERKRMLKWVIQVVIFLRNLLRWFEKTFYIKTYYNIQNSKFPSKFRAERWWTMVMRN